MAMNRASGIAWVNMKTLVQRKYSESFKNANWVILLRIKCLVFHAVDEHIAANGFLVVCRYNVDDCGVGDNRDRLHFSLVLYSYNMHIFSCSYQLTHISIILMIYLKKQKNKLWAWGWSSQHPELKFILGKWYYMEHWYWFKKKIKLSDQEQMPPLRTAASSGCVLLPHLLSFITLHTNTTVPL